MACVSVRVPGTTANLAAGFDCLGCALQIYNTLTFTQAASGLRITGCPPEFANAENLAYRAYAAALRALGLPEEGLSIHISGGIPVSRGLGSSAALIAAGVSAANALHGYALPGEELLAVATALEGHPDNVAPALFGGLTASMMEGGVPITRQFALSPAWRFTVLIPPFPLRTAAARAALPAQVTHADAVHNLSHCALLLKALETGDGALLRASLSDRLHQPYRAAMIADYAAVRALALRAGADGVCISGAGPTLLALSRAPGLDARLQPELPERWQARTLEADFVGTVCDIM